MYRLIASDLDETLIGKDRKITEENIKMIQKAREAGVLFVPATGRGFATVTPTLKELGVYQASGQYVMSFNGGVLTENKGDRILDIRGMSYELACELFERSRQFNVVTRVYTLDTVYVFHMDEEERKFSARASGTVECFEEDLSFLRDRQLMKIVYANSSYPYLMEIEKNHLDDLKDVLDIGYSSGRYMEMNPKGVNKGTGLERLARLLGIDIRDTIAVGDNYNDLPMIRTAGLGVGVANTIEQMKPECDYITEKTCDEGAVAEVIRKFIFSAQAE